VLSCSTCSVCLEELGSETMRLSCDHAFHESCMVNWLTQQRDNNLAAACPVCRREISQEDAAPYITPAPDTPFSLSAKTLMVLLTLMCAVPAGKPSAALWGGSAPASGSAAEELEDEDDGDNDHGWRERLAALYAAPLGAASDSEDDDDDEIEVES